MGFSINTRDLPSVQSFAVAERLFNSITPKCGSGIRPIGERKNNNKQIIKNENNSGEVAYSLRLYNSDLITYTKHPDQPTETMHISMSNYPSVSTCSFIYVVSPGYFSRHPQKLGWLFHCNGNEYAYAKSRDVLTFERVADSGNNWNCVNPQKHRKVIRNRELAKAAREEVKPFLMYAKSLIDIVGGGRCCDMVWARLASHQLVSIAHLSNHLNDIDYYYKLMEIIVWNNYAQLKTFVYKAIYEEKEVDEIHEIS